MNLKIKINLFNANGAIFNANGPLQRQRGGFNAERATNISTPPGGIERTLGGERALTAHGMEVAEPPWNVFVLHTCLL